MRKWISERAVTKWMSKHQRGLREWLVLTAAVVAGIAGWQQIADERNARHQDEQQAAAAEHRDQAERISAWPASETERGATVILSNRSEQPIYTAIVSRVVIQGAGARTGRQLNESGEQQSLAVIPPGDFRISFPPGFGGMSRRPGIEIAFTDRTGAHWVRFSDGTLDEIKQEPADYYGLPLPLSWEIPRRAH